MHINCSCYLFLKIEITKQMSKKQIELIELWIRSPKPPTNVLSPRENQQQIRSPSSYTPDSIPSCIFDEPGNEIEIIASESSCSSSNVADIQHVSSSIEYETSNKSNLNKNQVLKLAVIIFPNGKATRYYVQNLFIGFSLLM
ncbi:unnamed protein product [Rotaria socialis]|uniref:Uncharacterized protein n=2 Tax=Rotaria socialis TaxID=392032 RepID=A0A818BRW8_9BILA|nr:unnamed protein product [Rotaria socialis]